MEPLDFWRLHDELTIEQAAYLCIGMAPNEIEHMAGGGAYLSEVTEAKVRIQLEAISSAIMSGMKRGQIKGDLIPSRIKYESGGITAERDGVHEASTVEVASLKEWFSSKGIRPKFFFPFSADNTDYLDPDHHRFAPKLAAAVRAWQALENPKEGVPPKKQIEKWVRENAKSLLLTDEDGVLSETAVEEISKVANWSPKGGAPKTPGGFQR
jgi:hypothetical protein